ncbi:MAG: polymerase sigma factor, sigma-70 family [Candidatus Krumholzibacteriota bacterium]|nr:polymerase sigma factor, sigma-70 family [Candidatus Krumholzibacteriota bacterium]
METVRSVPEFDEIYEAYASRVLNLAYRLTGDDETARDLTQDIFIKVYENLGSFEQRSEIFTWIYRIAVNHVTNHLKKEKRRRWLNLLDRRIPEVLGESASEAVYDTPSHDPSAQKKLEDAERAGVVWAAVRSLPAEYRVPLVLYQYDGMSYKDIAETLGLSLSAVETRIHRAKKKLVPKLEPWLDRI